MKRLSIFALNGCFINKTDLFNEILKINAFKARNSKVSNFFYSGLY